MVLENAPYYDEVAEGPPGGCAYWAQADDGVRIRVGVWAHDAAACATNGGADSKVARCNGTVFILPGRTECIEKFGRSAAQFATMGYACLAIDWRGQGLSDRLLDDPLVGHIEDFGDYQRDLETVIALAHELELPKPWFMLGHSMGGAIGLRRLMSAHPFNAALFTAPMWAIKYAPIEKAILVAMAPVLKALRRLRHRAPSTNKLPLLLTDPFEGNPLTSDPEMFAYMANQIKTYPALGLAGPSAMWVLRAQAEIDALAVLPAPDLPALVIFGTDEDVMEAGPVRARTNAWPKAELVEIKGARHEILMEKPSTRSDVFARAAALFEASR